jgi:hypothetical protein
VAAALGFRWDGKKTRVFARTKPDSFNTESLIAFLKDLKRFVHGEPVILVWDNLPAHRSKVMKQFLFDQRDWLEIDWLPGYAPDLNYTESGTTSSNANSQISAPTKLKRLPMPSAEDYGGSLIPFYYPFLSSSMRVFPFDQIVTVLCEIQ